MIVFTDYLWFNHGSAGVRPHHRRDRGDRRQERRHEGTVLVSAMHITAGVYVNDWEDGLIHDFEVWLEKLAPAGSTTGTIRPARTTRTRT